MMRFPRLVLLGGVAALALTGVAHARVPNTHTIDVRLPNGQVETIRYTGNVPPTVVVAPNGSFSAMPVALAPMADPFAMMQRIAADMDRQAAIMLQQVADLAARAPFDTAQPMTVGAGPGVCMQSVQITYTGHGAPHIVSHSSGACGPTAVPSAQPEAPVTTPAPRSIEVKAAQPAPYASLVHRVSTLSP